MVTVRMDLEVDKYTTTQEIFLSKVGISNNYQEDNLNLIAPFFVRLLNLTSNTGKTRHLVRIYQEKSTILCVHNQKERDDDFICIGAAYQSHTKNK